MHKRTFGGFKKNILGRFKEGKKIFFVFVQKKRQFLLCLTKHQMNLFLLPQWNFRIRTRWIQTETWNCDCRFLIYKGRWRLCFLLSGCLVLPPVTCHIILWLYGYEHRSRGDLGGICHHQTANGVSEWWVRCELADHVNREKANRSVTNCELELWGL